MAASLERNAVGIIKRLVHKSTVNSAYRTVTSESSTSVHGGSLENVGTLFMQPQVQQLLKKLIGFNLDAVFAPKLGSVRRPKYKLVTEAQLEELQEKAMQRGRKKLQMAPVLPAAQQDLATIISQDPDIAHFDIEKENTKYVFTDISYGISDQERCVVVRDQEGTLRDADYQERKQILQVYFPKPGRMYKMPQMFLEQHLEERLAEGKYKYILDRACVQFEPDDPEYQRVVQRTYEHVAEAGQFEVLQSSRHFGPMVFYLARVKRLDPLVIHILTTNRVEDAADAVRLYNLLHPSSSCATSAAEQPDSSASQLILWYTEHEAKESAIIELALQAALDATSSSEQQSMSS